MIPILEKKATIIVVLMIHLLAATREVILVIQNVNLGIFIVHRFVYLFILTILNLSM